MTLSDLLNLTSSPISNHIRRARLESSLCWITWPNRVLVYSRFRPLCACNPRCVLADIYPWAKFGRNWCSTFGCCALPRRKEYKWRTTKPTVWNYDTMTSPIKPNVHNVSQRHQGRTERRPQATCSKKSVKFGRVVFEISERTDSQTDILITILGSPLGSEVIVN